MRHNCETDCYFYMSDISYSNQKEYIKKNFEFGIFSAMQLSMSKRNYRKSLAERMLEEKTHSNKKINKKSIEIPMSNFHARNPTKKMAYVRSTRSFFENSTRIVQCKWIEIYRANSGENFWDIIQRHINI